MSFENIQERDLIQAFQSYIKMANSMSHLNMKIISTLESLHRVRMKLWAQSLALTQKPDPYKTAETDINDISRVIKKRKRPRVWSKVDGNVCAWRTFLDNSENDDEWRQIFRMSRNNFMKLCELLEPYVGKKRTNMRMPISVEKRIGITLHYLSNDDKYSSTAKFFGVGKTSVCKVFRQVCSAITDHLADVFIKKPSTLSQIESLCEEFHSTYGVPQTVGVLNINHVFIKRPNADSEIYQNKKIRHSIKVLSLVNSKHQFVDVNAEYPGSMSDADVFVNSGFQDILNCQDIPSKPINGTPVPVGFIGSSALPLLPNLKKKYPLQNMEGLSPNELTFNRFMETSETMAEIAIGRLKVRWGALRGDMDVNLRELPCIIKACYVLHNFCEEMGECCDEHEVNEVIWQDRIDQPPTEVLPLCDDHDTGRLSRDAISDYLNSNDS